MMRFIKKWWLLEHLDERILLHSRSDSKVLLSQEFFVKGNAEWPGLICRAPNIFSVFAWGRKLESVRKIKELESTPDFKRRIREYNDIFDVCVKQEYIEMVPTGKGLMPSVATPKYYHITGQIGLLQGLLEEHKLAWSMIIFPLVFWFIIGVLKSLVISN